MRKPFLKVNRKKISMAHTREIKYGIYGGVEEIDKIIIYLLHNCKFIYRKLFIQLISESWYTLSVTSLRIWSVTLPFFSIMAMIAS